MRARHDAKRWAGVDEEDGEDGEESVGTRRRLAAAAAANDDGDDADRVTMVAMTASRMAERSGGTKRGRRAARRDSGRFVVGVAFVLCEELDDHSHSSRLSQSAPLPRTGNRNEPVSSPSFPPRAFSHARARQSNQRKPTAPPFPPSSPFFPTMGEFLRALAFKLTGPTFANPAFGEALWDVARKATSRHIEQPDEMLNQQVCASCDRPSFGR